MNRKPSIQLREKLVALSGALTLAFTAWGFGGVIAWSLHIMLAGGLLTLALAVVPWPARFYDFSFKSFDGGKDHLTPKTPHLKPRRSSLSRLLRLPAFYFASAFLLYLAFGALNPAWQIASDERGWWIEAVTPPLASWLPTSVEAPYEPMNAWRILNMHLAAFSLALGLYTGLNSRRTFLFVLWTFVICASAMAAVAILQKYTNAEAVLGLLPSENLNYWGSFFYRNQAAAYLNWGIVITGVLYFYHARRSREEGRSGGPHFLAFCCIALIAVSVFLALSRGGILFGGTLVAVFLLFAVADYLISSFSIRTPLSVVLTLTFTLSLLLSIGLFQAYRAVDWQAIETRFGDIGATIEHANEDARALSSKQTWKMAQDNLWTGWGAGSFRYVFPEYQKEIPELYYYRNHPRKGWWGRKFFRYAHNDILQFLAEYGIIGCSLLILAILGLLAPALKALLHSPLSTFYCLLGGAAAASHAFLDFIFHSPAFWVALVGGLALSSLLLSIDAKRAQP